MLLCWVMGIAQRSFMMSPQLAPTQQCRGLLSKGSWNELVLGELALLRPNSWAPAVATCKESPEQSSKSGRGSCFGASLPCPPTPWGYTTPGLATTHRDDRRVTTERLLCEKISGKGTDGRVELARLLKRLGDGDVLMALPSLSVS